MRIRLDEQLAFDTLSGLPLLILKEERGRDGREYPAAWDRNAGLRVGCDALQRFGDIIMPSSPFWEA